MQKVIKWLKEHWRAASFTVGLLGCLTLLIGGIDWTDRANHPFWQAAWVVFAVLGGIGFIGGIFWLVSSKKKW